MTPTLSGRLQTRLVLVGVLGTAWLIVVGPLLPGLSGVGLADRYSAGLVAVGLTAILGLGWEVGYHLLQQLRWEKDWPTLFGLVVVLPEALLVRWVMTSGFLSSVPAVPATAFWLLFGTTWLLVWLAANGPVRVLALRWRYSGGRWW